jgi:hypothetical protein
VNLTPAASRLPVIGKRGDSACGQPTATENKVESEVIFDKTDNETEN